MRYVVRYSLLLMVAGLILLNILQIGVSRHAVDTIAKQAEQIRVLENQQWKYQFDKDLAEAKDQAHMVELLVIHHETMELFDDSHAAFARCYEFAAEHGVNFPTKAPLLFRYYQRWK